MLNTETLLFILRVGNINLYQTGGQLLEPSTVFEEFIRRSKRKTLSLLLRSTSRLRGTPCLSTRVFPFCFFEFKS